jgi:diguanylate cyclase (GGDEF)-like protein
MPHDRSAADAELLLDAINSMEEALVAYDSDGRLLVCNDAFKKMYGYSDAQARPGVHFRELGEIDIARGNIVVEDEQGEDYLARKAAYRLRLEGSFTVKLRDGRWLRTTDRAMRGGGHGHQAGDAALASMAGTLRALGRSADVAGRIGGEEFALVLPDASAEGAARVAERLRRAVSGTPVPGRTESFCMTVSIGIALQAPGDGSVDEVMARADLALYQAKQQGRNRVVVSAPA